MSEKALAGVIFVAGVAAMLIFMKSPSERVQEVEARSAQWQKDYAEQKDLERRIKQAKEDGARALEAADDAIRAEAATRRAALEKASVNITTSSQQGVRIDRYFLKRGDVITCTTTISGNSAAMFDCDGRL